jgi:hypothetical protein
LPRRARSLPDHGLVDVQFLAMVAVALAVVTRKMVPSLLMTAVVALIMLANETATRCYRRRIDSGAPGDDGTSAPSDIELTRWVSVIDRVLGSSD